MIVVAVVEIATDHLLPILVCIGIRIVLRLCRYAYAKTGIGTGLQRSRNIKA